MITPAFHFDMLKQYIPVYNEVSQKLLVCQQHSIIKSMVYV